METPVYHLEGVVRSKSDTEDFNGPLDLILSLLAKNKMEIQDIRISTVVDQYLAWMEQRRQMDLVVAGEFVSMASQLIFIKTRMLLSVNDEEALSEIEQLIASLEERQRSEAYAGIQTVQAELAQRYQTGRQTIARRQEQLIPDKTYPYRHNGKDLQHALWLLLHREKELPPPAAETMFRGIVGREPYPVADKAKELAARLLKLGRMGLKALFRGSKSRSELVAAFLAVLDLCKSGAVHLLNGEDGTAIEAESEEQKEMEL